MTTLAVSTIENGSSTIPPVETEVRNPGVKVASKTSTMRWPGGWVEALEALGKGAGGYSPFVRAVLWPILQGRLQVNLDDDGAVVSIVGRDKAGGRVTIVVGEDVRPIGSAAEVEPPIRQGRPPVPEAEKLLRRAVQAVKDAGVSVDDLVARLEEQRPKKRRRKAKS